ncbi:MAG: response regulator [Verrucomicrobiota bacterium]
MPTNMTEDIDLSNLENRCILIIDDNKSIHKDYRTVLCPDAEDESEEKLDQLEDMLFGEDDEPATRPKRIRNFALTSAYQGEEAYNIVKEGKNKNLRYPMAFVDMRMPPGWDGLETIEKIRELDQDMLFMIVTAYSDHTFETIVERLGPSVPVRILYKPFDPKEIYSTAYKMVSKWNELNITR